MSGVRNIFSLIYNLTMNRLTNEQRLQIIKFYYQNTCSVKEVQEPLSFYGQFNPPATVRWYLSFLPKMQDGATCHTAYVSMNLVGGEFCEHFISRSEQVNWPSRSCDWTPIFCGVMLRLISIQVSPLQLTHWKTTLKHLFVRYRPKCWMRMDHLRRSRDQHLHEIIFKC